MAETLHTRSGARGTASALARACHPEPTVAVTVFAVVLAAVAGNGVGTCAVVGAGVLCGQLVIGWSNDRLDLTRDRASGRTDKPLVNGAVSVPALERALGAAVLGLVVASAALGWRAGLVNLWVAAWGVAYNLRLKSTALSWLPYAMAFGALPAVATLALDAPRWPALWALGAGALLGVAGNLTNALPDLDDDAATGVRGLPHRLGARRSLVGSAVVLVAVTLLVVLGPPGRPGAPAWTALGVVLVVVAGGLRWALRAPASRRPFLGILGITAVDLIVLIGTGHGLR